MDIQSPGESLTLYYSPGACSLAAHIMLEEIAQPYLSQRIVIANGENKEPDYLLVNPRGRVPALKIRENDNDVILTELSAILLYLSRRFPGKHVVPEDVSGYMRAVEWIGWLSSTVHQTGSRMALRPDRFASDAKAQSEIKENGKKMLESAFSDIEMRLRGKTYALGEQFSAIDAFLLVFYRWGGRVGLKMRCTYPEYTRVMDSVRAREAVNRVVEFEGIEIE